MSKFSGNIFLIQNTSNYFWGKLGSFLVMKCFKNWSFQKNVNNKKWAPKMIILAINNWLWKSEFSRWPEVVRIKKLLLWNSLHCVRSLLWSATTLDILLYSVIKLRSGKNNFALKNSSLVTIMYWTEKCDVSQKKLN